MLKVIGPSSRVLPVGPLSPGFERQRQEIRAERHRLYFFVSEQAMNAQPHRLLLFFDTLIPSRLSEFYEGLEVGLVAQTAPVILINESPIVGSD